MNEDLIYYYNKRAKEYEIIYDKPERQNDLAKAKELLQTTFLNKQVLEVACGTGYWTESIAATAKEILATDVNDAVIEIARSKTYVNTKVRFERKDIFQLQSNIKHESLFGGFIWSHIKLQELNRFIITINDLVKTGGTIVLMDNNYVEGSNTPLSGTDEFGNTYQERKLEDGTMHKVLKNFLNEKFMHEILSNKARDIEIINLKYFWILTYKTV